MEIVLLMVFFRPIAAFFTAVGDPKLGPKFSVADLQSDLLTRVDWLSESVKDKTATVGIKKKRTFFFITGNFLAANITGKEVCSDFLTSSQGQLNASEELEWLQINFVIVH